MNKISSQTNIHNIVNQSSNNENNPYKTSSIIDNNENSDLSMLEIYLVCWMVIWY